MTIPSDLPFNENNPNIYINELEEYYDNDQLNKWEKSFFENIKTLVETGEELSSEQFNKLKEIYNEYCR